MRILHIDIDTLRPDHLGCYGYPRATSPHIDALAAEGVRFENCYVSDSPCLPSRAAFYSGRCGIRNGAINHGGKAADPFIPPAERGFTTFRDRLMVLVRQAGFYPVSVSPYAERHSAFWFYQGFREMINTGFGGMESAEQIIPYALDWLERKGTSDGWYLHVNIWDPHTPYRAPASMGNPFEKDPPPAWMTEDILRRTWDAYGPGCAQEPGGSYTDPSGYRQWPRMPDSISDMATYRKWIDGYDCGVRYADLQVGALVDKLRALGVLDDTLIVVSSDHGENQGELAVFGDHQTADHITNRVPLIVRHPKGLGGRGRVDTGLYYQFDWAATLLEMVGQKVPESWDGRSFFEAFRKEESAGREFLVLSNCAWSCQRSVRWGNYLFIRTYHSGFKNYPERMLFDVARDPHELNDLAPTRPDLVGHAMTCLDAWWADEMRRSPQAVDPLWIVMHEGGPFHARYTSPAFQAYVERLKKTGRAHWAEELIRRSRELR